MKGKWLSVSVVGLVFVGLLMYLVVYSVRVDQIAAHYRFGKVLKIIRPKLGLATERTGLAPAALPEGVPVEEKAGWFFKLPLFDKVEKVDQRIRHVDGPTAELQLPDDNLLLPRVYATWRITNPVAFQESLEGDEERAIDRLKEFIGGETQEVFGRYNLEDVVNSDPEKLKFDQIEEEIFSGVKQRLAAGEKAYGLEVCSLGITWIALPEAATPAVFERMKQERRTEAEALKVQGEAIKTTRIARAREQRDKILADAEAIAKRERAEGEAEAALSYKTLAQHPELANFLRSLESFVNICKVAAEKGQPITFVINTRTPPFQLLENGPMDRGAAGEGLPELPEPTAPLASDGGNGAAATGSSE